MSRSSEFDLSGADQLNDEQRNWQKQFNTNIGCLELLRFGGAFIAWQLVGAVAAAFVPVPFFVVFIVLWLLPFVFAFICTRWRPTYLLLRGILGNKNLPAEPYPGPFRLPPRQPLPWWAYLPGLWNLLLGLALLYLVIRYRSR